jgi:hypothetical protein
MDYSHVGWVCHSVDTVGGGQNVLVGDNGAATIETAVFEQSHLVGIGGIVGKLTANDSLFSWGGNYILVKFAKL